MDATLTWDSLLALEPRLADLEARIRAVEDDGGPFFCSNFVWLPLNADLKALIGVVRADRFRPGDPPVLSTGEAYGVAYDHLSPLMPPCRDCGCVAFQPWLQATWKGAERAPGEDAPR